MTVKNCIELLKRYKEQSENPVDDMGRPIEEPDLRKNIIAQSKQNYEMMKAHILKGKKFPQELKEELNPELKKLRLAREKILKEQANKPEVKDDGKKPKR